MPALMIRIGTGIVFSHCTYSTISSFLKDSTFFSPTLREAESTMALIICGISQYFFRVSFSIGTGEILLFELTFNLASTQRK